MGEEFFFCVLSYKNKHSGRVGQLPLHEYAQMFALWNKKLKKGTLLKLRQFSERFLRKFFQTLTVFRETPGVWRNILRRFGRPDIGLSRQEGLAKEQQRTGWVEGVHTL